MTVNEIKEKLAKKAVVFQTGGIKPTNELLESWIGCVKWKAKDEEIPLDKNGNEMFPIATLFIKDLPFVPEELEEIALITVFISDDLYGHRGQAQDYFCVRTYESLEDLEACEWKASNMKQFPLVPKMVENDYPMWDSEDIPEDIFEEIITLEEEEDIDYFDDIAEEMYSQHKIGGYAAYVQAGAWFEGYDFVFQISSDEKAQFNVVDSGKLYFFFNKEANNWEIHYDFY